MPHVHRSPSFRPQVELLEDRLPPGEVWLSTALGWAWLGAWDGDGEPSVRHHGDLTATAAEQRWAPVVQTHFGRSEARAPQTFDGSAAAPVDGTGIRFVDLLPLPKPHGPNGCGASGGIVDVVGNLPEAEYNQYIRPQSLRDWGNEPFIAVNPVDPCQVVVSSFAYGVFIQTDQGASKASIWYSSDGGSTWNIRFPITQGPVAGARVPNDQAYAYDADGLLHGAFLTFGSSSLNTYHGTTADPNQDGVDGRPPTLWQWNTGRVNQSPLTVGNSDQPWIALSPGQVFVSYSSFRGSGVEMRAAASADNGASFTADSPVSRGGALPLSGSTNPGLRITADQLGNVYSVFGRGDADGPGGTVHVSYRLNMSSDGGATWHFTDTTPNPGGLAVDDGFSLQRGLSFGGVNALRGNITAIESSALGDHIYVAYGKRDAANVDRIWLAEFHPDDKLGLVRSDNPVAVSVPDERAALPALAVSDSGTVYVMYDTFTGPQVTGQFHVHLASSVDQGQTFTDQVLYDFSPSGLSFSGDRLLGDYDKLVALGNTVYGVFSGKGNVNDPVSGINTTDKDVPVFFSLTEGSSPARRA